MCIFLQACCCSMLWCFLMLSHADTRHREVLRFLLDLVGEMWEIEVMLRLFCGVYDFMPNKKSIKNSQISCAYACVHACPVKSHTHTHTASHNREAKNKRPHAFCMSSPMYSVATGGISWDWQRYGGLDSEKRLQTSATSYGSWERTLNTSS